MGRLTAPVSTTDFGNSLESVIDLMNNERAFQPGKHHFKIEFFPGLAEKGVLEIYRNGKLS